MWKQELKDGEKHTPNEQHSQPSCLTSYPNYAKLGQPQDTKALICFTESLKQPRRTTHPHGNSQLFDAVMLKIGMAL